MSKMSKIHCMDFNALNGTHVKDVEDYRNICIVVSCINVEDVKDIKNTCMHAILANLTILHLNQMKYIHLSCHCSYSLLYQQCDAI